MCNGGQDISLEDIAKVDGEMEIWEQGLNIARNAQGKITKPFLQAVEDLRKEWAREVTKNATTTWTGRGGPPRS